MENLFVKLIERITRITEQGVNECSNGCRGVRNKTTFVCSYLISFFLHRIEIGDKIGTHNLNTTLFQALENIQTK